MEQCLNYIKSLIIANGHSEQTLSFTINLINAYYDHLIYEYSLFLYKTSILCYYMASNITEENKLSLDQLKSMINIENFSEDEMNKLTGHILKSLKWDILLYL
jgi:hypothetical protein